MLYVFHGEDIYRSQKKVRDITDRFYTVSGGRESAARVFLPECSRLDAEQLMTTGSLFRAKRLVVMEELNAASADVCLYVKEQLPKLVKSEDVYVLWDRVPLEKTDMGAEIVASATKAQECRRLTSQTAARFLDEEAQARGISLSLSQKRHILSHVSSDSWALIQALEKSALAPPPLSLAEGDTTALRTGGYRAIFGFLDAYGFCDRPRAFTLFHALVRSGVESEKIYWRLLGQIKTTLAVGSLVSRGVAAADVPRIAKVHPFVAKKAAAAVARVPLPHLKHQHTSLVMLDFEAKQSRGDIALGLERMLLSV